MTWPVTIDQLRVLLAIAETGSFSAAARRLGRTQGAISYNVATLESLLEVSLFNREGRRPVLTGAGETLLGQARGVLDSLAALQTTAKSIREGLEPILSLAIDTLFPANRLTETLRMFRQSYPSVQLDLRINILSTVVSWVDDGVCGLGITGIAATPIGRFVSLPCGSVNLVAVAAPTHPLVQRKGALSDIDLREHTNIVLSDHVSTPTLGATVNSQSVWRVNDSGLRRHLIREGLGWGRMSIEEVRQDIKDGALVRLKTKRWRSGTEISFHVTHLKDNPPGPAGSWLIKYLTS